MKPCFALVTCVVVAGISGAAGAQQMGHDMASQPPGGSGPPAALVTACVSAHQQVAALADRLTQRLEGARQANSPQQMRGAVEDLQAGLTELRSKAAQCDPLQAAAQPAGPPGGRNMANMAGMGSQTPAMNPGSTAPAAGAMAGVDHSKTPMGGAAAKPGGAAGAKPAAPMAGMDHSKMPMSGAAPKSGAAGAKPAAPMAGMDHSKMASGRAPKAGDHGAMTDSAKLPVVPVARVADPQCPDMVNKQDAAKAIYQGKVYMFCSAADRDRFRKNPKAYLEKQPR